AAAIQNILLLAETMNLACCWASYNSYGDILNENEIRKKLQIPEYFLFAGSIAIGHKSNEVFEVPRDNFKEHYVINRFS
ncbi:MAG: nitroreductase family protein, partial [Candidatus Hodarchaeota archaeon]